MGLFLNLLHLPEDVTNDALEGIYKALSDGHDHGDGEGIWSPHESPLIRRLVELFTQRGLDRLEAVKKAVLDWQSGANHKPGDAPIHAPNGMVQRWGPDELALARAYLEALPPAQWTLDDHMLAIDLVVQTYLPADQLVKEAEWLAVRAGMMGKVQAAMTAAATLSQADKILAAMPSTVAGAAQQFNLEHAQRAMLDFARARAAEQVQALADSARHRLRTIIAADLEQRAFGSVPAGTSSLQTKLMDAFGDLNRDWRRIAVTEAGEAQTQGFIASLKPGTKVKRIEQYKGACNFCRRIHGVVAEVVAPDHPDKNPDTMVWPGKNNIGRSASPRKRVGDVLVARDPDEMWWLPAGLAHPHCRGRWVLVGDLPQGGNSEFTATLTQILRG